MKKFIYTLIICSTFFSTVAFGSSFFTKIPNNISDRTISVSGEISDMMADQIVTRLKSLDKENNEEIEMTITSYGGSVYDGLKILDAMKQVKSPIKTICEGYCMSMGAIILVSGTPGKRFSMPNATILLHEISSGTRGSLTQMENDLKEGKRLQGLLTNILKDATCLDEETLTKLMDHDNYMTPQEAMDLNLIDGIIGK